MAVRSALAAWMAFAVFFPACTHVAGVVEQAPGLPMPTAVLSVGRPNGIAAYEPHKVDAHGRFDFYIGPGDETNLYLYDGAADPRLTLRRIDRNEMGEHMRLELRPASESNLNMETP